ncbi:Gmad2 immunoglobulin-like domain-containing protein [Candidatus Parcubacteria bacterium]|nr:Gmad2 immunoglobulin-like domain-containing protein [Patescibacteria group bacterium]MCG2694218.1 Gmad2 immunoglobulin-like domain-containing protein [Candidatus Parcubacteria bacterium]
MKHKKIIIILSIIIVVLGIVKVTLLYIIKSQNQNIAYDDKIIVYNFAEGQEIESPLVIKGKARGTWFFEGSFPIILVNWDGLIIAQSYATAKTEWMTEDYVEFEGTITFDKPTVYNRGALIFKKDNPSGLPEYDDALEISILYKYIQ